VPSIINRPRFPPQRVVVSERVAVALRPEALRDVIPARVTLAENAPPYAGELREEHTGAVVKVLGAGAMVSLATLRRAWNYVGWAINPGDADAGQLLAQIRVLTRGINGYTAAVSVPAGLPFALVGLIVGAACELVVTNTGDEPVTLVRGSIWGMSEK
jgi:hypothetical protein